MNISLNFFFSDTLVEDKFSIPFYIPVTIFVLIFGSLLIGKLWRKKNQFDWVHLESGIILPNSRYEVLESDYYNGRLKGIYGICDSFDPQALILKELFSNNNYPNFRWVTVIRKGIPWQFLIDVEHETSNLKNLVEAPLKRTMTLHTSATTQNSSLWFVAPEIALWQSLEQNKGLVLSVGRFPSSDIIALKHASREALISNLGLVTFDGSIPNPIRGVNAPYMVSPNFFNVMPNNYTNDIGILTPRAQGGYSVFTIIIPFGQKHTIYHTDIIL